MTSAQNAPHLRVTAGKSINSYMQMITEIILLYTKEWTYCRIQSKCKSKLIDMNEWRLLEKYECLVISNA